MKKLITLLLAGLIPFLGNAQEKPAFVPGNIIVQVPNKSVDEVVVANQFFEGQQTDLKVDRLLSAPMAAYLLEFNPNIHHDRFLQQLWNHPAVTLIQLNHYVENRATVPDDPQFNQQWWHKNGGGGGGTADADIDSDEAWDITTGGVTALGDTIVVCVVDDGGDLDHPDLMANNWVNHHEIPNNNQDDDNNGYVDDYLGWNPVSDDDDVDGGNHGVSVAGMIGAVGDNNTGVVGVNWNVKIMNMTYGNINQEANVIEAYTYPLVMRRQYNQTGGALGAFVVATNSSWGINYGDPADAPLWCAFYDTLGAAGILSAGATANLDINIDTEGDLPTACSSEYMISVTATNNSDVRTFSGYGQTTVDLGAPGEDVRTTASGGNYTTTSGTSFASPATAGAVALMYSAPCASLASIALANPELGAQMVRDAIFNGVDPISNLSNECVTGGRLNIKDALNEILNNCASGGCLPPFSITATAITDEEATISFAYLPDVDTFNIYYGIEGGTSVAVNNLTTSPYELTGLTPCEDYWVSMQSICDGEASEWTDSIYFSTDGCCEPPLTFELSGATETAVTATWSPVLAADSYVVRWRETGTSTWSDSTDITAVSLNITDLEPCTEYEVQVATYCNGSFTNFTPVEVFTTFGCGSCTDETFCESNGDVQYEWISNVTVDVLNNSSSADPSGYQDFTNMSIDLQRGQTYDVSFSPDFSGSSYNEHFRLWIDMNQNGTFSNAEMLFDDDQGSSTTVTGTIEIPLTAELGSARMRVSMAYGGQFGGDYPQNSCENDHEGEVEDYCVNILEEDPINPGIEEANGVFGMEVYPVPATDLITVQSNELTAGTVEISVLDAFGRKVEVLPTSGQRTERMDISKLAVGMYVIELHKQGQIVGRARFVKQ